MVLKENRYARKRQHIDELKKKHAVRYNVFDPGRDEREAKEDYERSLAEGHIYKWDDPRNDGYNYWVDFSLSGPRQYAKFCTNRKIRQMYRNLENMENLENVMGLHGSDYEKIFDYWWTIY